MLATSVVKVVDDEPWVVVSVSNAPTRATAAVTASFVVVKSEAIALSSTLESNVVIWAAWTAEPKAPADPSARLRND